MFKSMLQELCQRRQWPLPEYDATREGPDHDPRFRASVAVAGALFHSPDSSMSSKEAQNNAAHVAVEHLSSPSTSIPKAPAAPEGKGQLQASTQERSSDLPLCSSLPKDSPNSSLSVMATGVGGQNFESPEHGNMEKQQVNFSFYKNLLQELAQKDGCSLPKYTTIRIGEPHIPIFSSTVEIKGECFEGDAAKTKKQAEINAAKVAWNHLKEREQVMINSVLDNSASQGQNASFPQNQGANNSHCSTAGVSDNISLMEELAPLQQPYPVTETEKGDTEDDELSMDGSLSSSGSVNSSSNIVIGNTENLKLEETCSLLCNRVCVYPRKPDLVFPKGANVLPFSDDMWVAVSLDFSNQEDS